MEMQSQKLERLLSMKRAGWANLPKTGSILGLTIPAGHQVQDVSFDESIVNVFLRRYLADLQQGKLRSRHEYEALYPGREELIAAEYERLHLAAADTEHLDKLRRVRASSDLGDDGSIVA